MQPIDATLKQTLINHRVQASDVEAVTRGVVRYAPLKSLWVFAMLLGTVIGGVATFTWSAFALFAATTATVLMFGHSLGSHRKLIHNSFQCSKTLEYALVYLGVQVGLAGPIGLLRQHELRDFAQRLPTCHDYLRHGRSFWRDAWWQLHCDLLLSAPPQIRIEDSIAKDRFYLWLERTWMLQQLPWALLFLAWGGWGFVFWGVCARVTAGVVGHWLIGYFAHNSGSQHYLVRGAAVQGRNIAMTSLLTMGECWHNNHHACPGSAKLGLYPGEWDPGWWMLVVLKRCGLVWEIRLPQDLSPRAELIELPRATPPAIAPAGVRSTIALARSRTIESMPRILRWPAFYISKHAMHRMTGNTLELNSNAALPVLSLELNGTTLFGLPALYVALTRRVTALKTFAWMCVPAVVCIERLRPSTWRTA